MQTLFEKLYRGETLTLAESRELFSAIIRGELSETQLAAALISMKMRGEQPDEIAGAAQACLNNARAFPRPDYRFSDIVGTGGDASD
ncbi:anthranilate phosphoribosyltransferase, partial [Klebsiella pneumoniae]|nr:anthranilate phosphoribosyltransferase [Klebsiella pneumoniae]